MSTLIIMLPLEAAQAQTEFDFIVIAEGGGVVQAGRARAEALPLLDKSGDDCVALAPLRALSWHRVILPDGVSPGAARLPAVLAGLLEDELLDAPERLHFALPPGSGPGLPQWVAACDRRWLAMAYQALQAAGRPVSRVLPEWGPPASPLRLHVAGPVEDPVLLVSSEAGVSAFALSLGAPDWLLASQHGEGGEHGDGGAPNPGDDMLVTAEAGLTEQASALLKRPVQPLSRDERWIAAAAARWDLAHRLTLRKHARRVRFEWLLAPRWRSARWAALLLLGVNLLGLNAWAWIDRQQLRAQQALVTQVLSRSFPQLKTIVDAPAQMAREVRLLAQASASPAAADLDVMLAVLGRTLPPERSALQLDYRNAELRLQGLALQPGEARSLTSALQAQGYRFTLAGANALVAPLTPLTPMAPITPAAPIAQAAPAPDFQPPAQTGPRSSPAMTPAPATAAPTAPPTTATPARPVKATP